MRYRSTFLSPKLKKLDARKADFIAHRSLLPDACNRVACFLAFCAATGETTSVKDYQNRTGSGVKRCKYER
jgi:hypothetical protein